ncbi:RNA polymerase sigma factor [Planctomicrobium sp. SH668]|uniref:RNA polymerase sigma factor n=1 Tax=Planctomicrobium sp. SH668 TaxID=3448126 RepID=UPI003F5BF392
MAIDSTSTLQKNQTASGQYDWLAGLRENEPWLRRVIYNRVGDRDVVDDVMQEISLAITRPEIRPKESQRLSSWLYQVAVRQAYLYRRKMGRQRRHFAPASNASVDSAIGHEVDPIHWLMGREHQQGIREALKGLSETDREILMLKYGENWTYQQLADRLGVTVHTIEHRLLRSKKKLRQLLKSAHVEEVT